MKRIHLRHLRIAMKCYLVAVRWSPLICVIFLSGCVNIRDIGSSGISPLESMVAKPLGHIIILRCSDLEDANGNKLERKRNVAVCVPM